jgi:hypothetical protein
MSLMKLPWRVQIRMWFSAGRALRTVAADLNALGVPVNCGAQWYRPTVKRVLMSGPRVPSKRAA